MNGLRRSFIAFSAVERYGAYAIGLAGMAGASRLLTPLAISVSSRWPPSSWAWWMC